MGPKGRKALVDAWAQYLPLYTQTETINQQAVSHPTQNNVNSNSGQPNSPEAPVRYLLLTFIIKLISFNIKGRGV